VLEIVGICHDERCCTERAFNYLAGRVSGMGGWKRARERGFRVYLEIDRRLQEEVDELLGSGDVRRFIRSADRKLIGYVPGRLCSIHLVAKLRGTGLEAVAVDHGGTASSQFHYRALHNNRYEDILNAAREDLRREMEMAEAAGEGVLFVGYLHTREGSYFEKLGVPIKDICENRWYPPYTAKYLEAKKMLMGDTCGP